jgi:5'-deoxynucleotidase YfbR-like HD superfamily hydrolase
MQEQLEKMTRAQMMTSRALAARVKRYHSWPTHHQQTVGEHSARVATIYVEVFGLPRAEVLYRILHHDSGELFAGDPPFPVKQKYPHYKRGHSDAEEEGLRQLSVELPELAEWELWRVKVADLLEMHEFGVVEMDMGNRYAEPIVCDTRQAARTTAHDKLQPDDFSATDRWLNKYGRTI